MEAWASGVPVLGSKFAQSVETNCENDVNGWVFDVTDQRSIDQALQTALSKTCNDLQVMSRNCRSLIKEYSADRSAEQMVQVVQTALATVKRKEPHVRHVATTSNRTAETVAKPVASLSLDLDNKWSYLKSHNDSSWESHPGYLKLVVPRILSVLDELDIKMTFFIVGQDAVIQENAEPLKMISDKGHEVANHSFHHEPCLHLYTPCQLDNELQMAEAAIKRVTGQTTVGFRGPGFSLSDQTLNALVRRDYKYDCTMFPTFLSPLARTYYFMTGSFTRKQVKEKQALFGKFSDGFMPNSPYLWKTEHGDLLEIPVTTFPGLKTPVHATYLHYLASFSSWTARAYWNTALNCCHWAGVAPSFLLHPLDFLGEDDEPALRFFPGMNVDSKTKQDRIRDYLGMYHQKFNIVTMQQYATMALSGNLNRHSLGLVRSGVT